MRITDVITQCDRIKPNEYTYDDKRRWVEKAETDIRRFANRFSLEKADMSFKTEEDPQLFLGTEYMDIYLYYLISMIDLSNQEYALYNNSSAFFNSLFLKWQKNHRRENIPEKSAQIKV